MPTSPESEWYATPKSRRHRKPVLVTMSEEERERVEMLAEAHGRPISRVLAAAMLAFSRMSRRAQAAELAEAGDAPPPKTRTRRK